MKKYRTIVSGATFLGLAVASCDPNNTLIVERGNVLGSDYYTSLRIDRLGNYQMKEAATKKLYQSIIKNKHMYYEDLLIISEIMPVIGNFVKEMNINILLDCTVMEKVQKSHGLAVEAFCRDQVMTFESDYFIDTTADNLKLPHEMSCCSLVRSKGSDPVVCRDGSRYDLGNGVYCLEIPVKTASMKDNRRQVLAHFEKPMKSEDELLMIAETPCIRGKYEAERTGNIIYACSSLTQNVFEAMDKGIELWRDL